MRRSTYIDLKDNYLYVYVSCGVLKSRECTFSARRADRVFCLSLSTQTASSAGESDFALVLWCMGVHLNTFRSNSTS